MRNKTISVVIPVLNEADNISPLMEEFVEVRKALPSMDILWVDDGSHDGTWTRIQAAAEPYTWCRGLRLASRSGQSTALLTGLQHASGELIITMDGDLQNDPSDIPRIIDALNTFDVVCGYRKNRKDSWSKRTGSRLANAVRHCFTKDNIKDSGCSLKGFHRHCLSDLPPLHGFHRFMPAWFRLHNRTMTEIAVNHRPREHGTSKYTNLNRLPTTIRDLAGYCWYRSRYRSRVEPIDKI